MKFTIKFYIYTIFIIFILVYFIYTSPNFHFFISQLSLLIDLLPIPKFIKNIFYLFFLNNNKNKQFMEDRSKSKLINKLTPLKKKMVASNQKWVCSHCKKLLDYTYEIDHIIPTSQGGSSNIDNLQALCRNCHGKKTLLSYL